MIEIVAMGLYRYLGTLVSDMRLSACGFGSTVPRQPRKKLTSLEPTLTLGHLPFKVLY